MRQSTNYFIKILSALCILCVLCGSISVSVKAQVRPVNDYGAIGLAQLLKRLNTTANLQKGSSGTSISVCFAFDYGRNRRAFLFL